MQFDSLSAFITMGGHGVFVWSVYGVTLLVLLFLAITPMLKKRQFFVDQAMRLRREQQADQRASSKTNL